MIKRMKWLAIFVCSGGMFFPSVAQGNDAVGILASTPPMGWNSYNCFGGNVTEAEMKQNTDYMAEHLKQYGWEYVVLDFLWYCDDQNSPEKFANRRPVQHMDEYGRVIPSEVLHPSSPNGNGLKPLADYVHAKGLKFGIHIMRGMPWQAVVENTPIKGTDKRAQDVCNLPDTCKWYGGFVGVDMSKPGAQEYYNSLFELYASWGIDFIKVDDLSYPYHADEIEAVAEAIRRCGRPIVLSLSPGPAFIGNPKHLQEHANMWRISADFWDSWEQLAEQLQLCRMWWKHTKEGHWPDADMLPLGHLQLRHEAAGSKPHYSYFTRDEQYFMMTLWSIFRSPLMIGGNLPDNDEFTLSLLTNKDVIRVNQCTRNNQELSFEGGISIWYAEDKKRDEVYVAFLNTNEEATSLSFSTSSLPQSKEYVTSKNLWTGEQSAVKKGRFQVNIPPHGAVLLGLK